MTRNHSRSTELARKLAAKRLRATPQRIAVLDVLDRARGHPTASEIHQQLSEQHPNMSLKTVYDALEAFVNAGLARSVTDGGVPYRYERNTEPHYHAKCSVCGALFDLPAKANREIRRHTSLPKGFELEEIRVTLLGRCPHCVD